MYVCMAGEVDGDASKVMGEVMQVDDGDEDEDEETDKGLKRQREDDQLMEQMVSYVQCVCTVCMHYVCTKCTYIGVWKYRTVLYVCVCMYVCMASEPQVWVYAIRKFEFNWFLYV